MQFENDIKFFKNTDIEDKENLTKNPKTTKENISDSSDKQNMKSDKTAQFAGNEEAKSDGKGNGKKNHDVSFKNIPILLPYTHFSTNPAQLTQVPLNGPLKSTSVIMQQQQNLIPVSHMNAIEKSGMHGQYVQVSLSSKQQKSQLVHNYIKYLEEFY